MKTKTAVLLINLGTPDELTPRAVRRYLREFLNDPRVVDIHWMARWLLVNTLIVPFRYKNTTDAYQKIWQAEGSPLLVYTEKLSKRLGAYLGENYQVEFAMRYGNPSIKRVLAKFSGCNHVVIIPLFPQYSSAATGSAIEKVLQEVRLAWNTPSIKVVHEFYEHPNFIKAYAAIIAQHVNPQQVDKILFSYHGLPERHITKSQCHAACDHKGACPRMSDANNYCYRAQCYATSCAIASELNLPEQNYVVCFQSRLGRTPWIQPYTDQVLPALIKQGDRRIAIVSPSFAVDCLETLEEINIRLRKQWYDLGGKEFIFIPCLNDSALFVSALADLV